MTKNEKSRNRRATGNGSREFYNMKYSKKSYQNPRHNSKVVLPRLASLGIVALHRYKSELASLEITREISNLVECCDVILMANESRP